MALPITYFDPPHLDELMQGDILERTPELDLVIKEVHPYFVQTKYLYFMVITQTCDLVPRHDGVCKSPYISIAPVRSLDVVLEREIDELQLPIRADIPVVTQKSRAKLELFLARLFNNNEPGYFYLDAEDTLLSENCCAFLSLGIAIKAPLHFGKCLQAKRLELKPEWQAKLGWLIAQMYSRVGTEDWTPDQIQKKVRTALSDTVVTVPDAKAQGLQAEIAVQLQGNPDLRLGARDITKIANKIGNTRREVIRQALEIISKTLPEGTPDGVLATIQRRLETDPGLQTLLKS